MQDKQGRNGPSVPVMPEVAVQSDGGLRRPAQEAARPASDTDATTALEAALSARVKRIYSTPPPPPPHICSSTPRLSDSRNSLPPAHLPLHNAPVMIERGLSGPRSPSETSPRGSAPSLLRCSRQPRRLPPGRGITAWNRRAGPSPRQRAMGDACADSGRNQYEVIHVQP